MLTKCGGGALKARSFMLLFSKFLGLQKWLLDPLCHVHIGQVAPQRNHVDTVDFEIGFEQISGVSL